TMCARRAVPHGRAVYAFQSPPVLVVVNHFSARRCHHVRRPAGDEMDGKLIASTLIATALCARVVGASGHGPLFGAGTPTLGKRGWEFDQAWMGQVMNGPDPGGQLLRTMISTGITDRVQVSLSAPIPLESTDLLPSGRMMSMMSYNRDLEALGAWRFTSKPV